MKKLLSTIEKKVFFFFILLGINLILFRETLHIGFLSDDFHMLSVTAHQEGVLSYFTHNIIGTRQGSSYGPLWNVLFSLEYLLFGLKAFFYHCLSVFFHSTIAFFVFLLAKKFTQKEKIAFGAAILFSVFPGHVEAISWISVQVHLLASLLFLLALYFYVCFLEEKKGTYYFMSLLFSFGSLLTKEIGVTFFLAICLLELFYVGFTHSGNLFERIGSFCLRALKRIILPFVILVAYFMLRIYATGVFAGSYSKSSFSFNFFTYFKTFLEISLSIFLPFHWRNVAVSFLTSHLFFFGVGFVILVFVILFLKKWRKTLLLLLSLYGVTALPYLELSLNPVNYEGERYGYLVSVWMAIILATSFYVLLEKWQRRRVGVQIFWLCIFAMSFFLGIFSYQKIPLWKTSGEMVQKIIKSGQTLSIPKDTFIYFIGMPDNIDGAQVMRNGIFEVLEIFSGQHLQGKRVGMFSYFLKDTMSDPYIRVQNTKMGYVLESDSKLSFTGFPELSEEHFHFILKDFTMPGFLGSSIEIERIQSQESPEMARFVYFNGEALQEIE
ncbi:MAG: hypothetical protein COV59_05600 [Candidatus Magasanikbacteria bacterium CG11_big_fil_rev_8_21_14_0_20_39_34]|uniref:Glycosyltransferase RgtA/B/C/D-like domain-containing protein n=1 Tax=Candidatus Magasanikbacteria bacterium CG11_big_fil_rev_8_21_14_0_20_39_34 TaxID=1974653 RepID=A0A2H0N422_9BACT|nr:MAG: hypothetical protein COV59_05600 [Candidatus Magasanikbacteria bacterium CG11_big_fil_rev_8_21_14_0_20_39_34]